MEKNGELVSNPWMVKNLKEFQIYQCPDCDFNNVDQSDFINHTSTVHQKHLDTNSCRIFRFYECPECDNISASKMRFIKHAVINHEKCESLIESLIVGDVIQAAVSTKQDQIEAKINNEAESQTDRKSKTTNSGGQMRHVNCYICKKAFQVPINNLSEGFKGVLLGKCPACCSKNEIKQFPCVLCGFSCESEITLTTHISRAHGGHKKQVGQQTRPLKVPIITVSNDAQFEDRMQLQITHPNADPLNLTIYKEKGKMLCHYKTCGELFDKSNDLVQHLKRHLGLAKAQIVTNEKIVIDNITQSNSKKTSNVTIYKLPSVTVEKSTNPKTESIVKGVNKISFRERNVKLFENLDTFKNADTQFKDFEKCRLCDYHYFNRLDLCRHLIDNHIKELSGVQVQQSKRLQKHREYHFSYCNLEVALIFRQNKLSDFMPTSNDFEKESNSTIESLPKLDFDQVSNLPKCEFCGHDFEQSKNWKKMKLVHLTHHFPKSAFSTRKHCDCVVAENQENWGFSYHLATFQLDMFQAFHNELGDKWSKKWNYKNTPQWSEFRDPNHLFTRLTENVKVQKSAEFQYACQECNHYFKSEEDLENHIFAIHLQSDQELTEEKLQEEVSEFCLRLPKLSESEILKHTEISEEANISKVNCEETIAPKSRKLSNKKSKENIDQERSLSKQIKEHAKKSPFCCNICDKEFTHNHQLLRHLKAHKGTEQFKCTQCDEKFMRSYQLASHVQIHLADKDPETEVPTEEQNTVNTDENNVPDLEALDSISDLTMDIEFEETKPQVCGLSSATKVTHENIKREDSEKDISPNQDVQRPGIKRNLKSRKRKITGSPEQALKKRKKVRKIHS